MTKTVPGISSRNATSSKETEDPIRVTDCADGTRLVAGRLEDGAYYQLLKLNPGQHLGLRLLEWFLSPSLEFEGEDSQKKDHLHGLLKQMEARTRKELPAKYSPITIDSMFNRLRYHAKSEINNIRPVPGKRTFCTLCDTPVVDSRGRIHDTCPEIRVLHPARLLFGIDPFTQSSSLSSLHHLPVSSVESIPSTALRA